MFVNRWTSQYYFFLFVLESLRGIYRATFKNKWSTERWGSKEEKMRN